MKIVLQVIGLLIGAVYLISFFSGKNHFEGTYSFFKPEYVKTITLKDDTKLKLERVVFYPENRNFLPFTRYQFRAADGNVVAYTPTRGQAVSYCTSYDNCYVFMWKTAYPLPGIFKFNPDPRSWIWHKNPPMKYSTSGNDGYGFTNVTEPLFGTLGLILFIFHKLWYYVILAFLSFLVIGQMIKFHDLPEDRKKEWMRLLMAFNMFIHVIPLDPYVITGGLLILAQFIGVLYVGIPITHTFVVSIAAFLWGAIYAAKFNRGDLKLKRV